MLDEIGHHFPLLSNFTFRVYISYFKFVLEILGSIDALRERQGGRKQGDRERGQ